MSPASLCTVVQFVQRASLRSFNDYNNLLVAELTTNRAVGSSNLSGRANKSKALRVRAFSLASFLRESCVNRESRKIHATCCAESQSALKRPSDEPSRLNHAIITQRPIELIAKPHLTTWLTTKLLSSHRQRKRSVAELCLPKTISRLFVVATNRHAGHTRSAKRNVFPWPEKIANKA